MEKIKHNKAQLLYDVLDDSRLFTCAAEKGSRSDMNVTFRSASEELDAKFVAEATEAGFVNLKGHRNVGGMRASIYNAMPVEGVEKLCGLLSGRSTKTTEVVLSDPAAGFEFAVTPAKRSGASCGRSAGVTFCAHRKLPKAHRDMPCAPLRGVWQNFAIAVPQKFCRLLR